MQLWQRVVLLPHASRQPSFSSSFARISSLYSASVSNSIHPLQTHRLLPKLPLPLISFTVHLNTAGFALLELLLHDTLRKVTFISTSSPIFYRSADLQSLMPLPEPIVEKNPQPFRCPNGGVPSTKCPSKLSLIMSPPPLLCHSTSIVLELFSRPYRLRSTSSSETLNRSLFTSTPL